MRPYVYTPLRVSLVLNVFLLMACSVWYVYQPSVEERFRQEGDAWTAMNLLARPELIADCAEPNNSGSASAAEMTASLPLFMAEAASSEDQEHPSLSPLQPPLSSPEPSSTLKPHCALYQLNNCRTRVLRPSVKMRGTRFWVMYNLVVGERQFACDETITYTTHGDFTFIDNLGPLVDRWRAPVSFGLYAPGNDFVVSLRSIAYLRQCGDPLIAQFITFHVIFDVDKVSPEASRTAQILNETQKCDAPPPWRGTVSYRTVKRLTYPVNVARNVARETVMTHFVLPSDVELYPSGELVSDFMDMVRRNDPVLCQPRPKVYVLSIFEVAEDMKPPHYKDELITMLKNGTAIQFHKHMCPLCHTLPKAKQWTFSPQTPQLDVFHVGKRHKPFHKWEPIYICTNEEPGYDERLTWEGKMDKMGQGYTLCLLDYDFLILNDAFLVHKPGIKKHKPDKWRGKLVTKQRSFIINAARLELNNIYGTSAKCELN